MTASRGTHESEPEGAVCDALLGGRLMLWQPRIGYRVNVDTLLLAYFASRTRTRARRLVDVGAGTGALALAYGLHATVDRAELIETEPPLARLAAKNLALAHVRGDVHELDILRDDVPESLVGASDVVLSNPPFFQPARVSLSSSTPRQRARHGALEPFVRTAASVMGRRAYAYFVYPAPSLPEFLHVARRTGLVAKRLQFVHPFERAPARLALLELKRAKEGGLAVEPPIVEWAARGVRTALLADITEGHWTIAAKRPAQRIPSNRSRTMATAARTLK